MATAATLIGVQGALPHDSLEVMPQTPFPTATGCLYVSSFEYLHYVWICHLVFETWITALTLYKAAEQRVSSSSPFSTLHADRTIYSFRKNAPSNTSPPSPLPRRVLVRIRHPSSSNHQPHILVLGQVKSTRGIYYIHLSGFPLRNGEPDHPYSPFQTRSSRPRKTE